MNTVYIHIKLKLTDSLESDENRICGNSELYIEKTHHISKWSAFKKLLKTKNENYELTYFEGSLDELWTLNVRSCKYSGGSGFIDRKNHKKKTSRTVWERDMLNLAW